MAKTVYKGCTYEGGYLKLKPSDEATLELEDEKFTVRRPRVLFSGNLRNIWAKWSAVTELEVEETDDGARLKMTTKARGTGSTVIHGVTPEELWEILDELGDLKDRFHNGTARLADAGHNAGDESEDDDDEVGDEAEQADDLDETDDDAEAHRQSGS